jgi:hypothetical protein
MPITLSEASTPGGHRVLRSHAQGVVDAADAAHLKLRLAAGAPCHGWPLLAVQESDSRFTVEGRQAFVSFGEAIALTAIVVTSAPLRVMLNFVIRASQAAGGARPGQVRFFSTEGEALAWLDAELPRAA